MSREQLREVAKKMAAFRKVLLFPHVNMDGDSLGSSFALCTGLRQLGCDAYIYAGQTVPHNLNFLGEGCLTEEPPFQGEDYLSLLVDCGSRSLHEAPPQCGGFLPSYWNAGSCPYRC